ncbi:MAG TPA: autotransporter domain-containing protein [Pseudomonadales bacterium]|nr:autotransporter domain-containing protein [Pseudomonadales bacterium]
MKFKLKNQLPIYMLLAAPAAAMAADPIAVDDARTTLQNVPVTVNVLANDYDADGDTLSVVSISTPSNASASLNSDGSVLVTPNKDFTGQIQFTYVLTDNTGQSRNATGTVTVSVGAFNLQTGALNPNDRSLAAALDNLCPRLQLLSDTSINAGTSALRDRCLALYQLGLNNPQATEQILTKLAPEEMFAQSQVQEQFATRQTKNIQQRILMLKQGARGAQVGIVSGSGQAFSGGSAGEDINSPWGLFVNGVLDDGKRDRTDNEAGYDYKGTGVTAGMDYRISDTLIAGAAVGFNSDALDYSSHGGSLDSRVSNILLYGTWYVNAWSLDGMLGYGRGSVDSKRHISYTDVSGDFTADAKGKTNSDQAVASATVSYDWSSAGYTVTPFFSVDWNSNHLDAFEENGGGGWELAFDKQSTSSVLTSLGARGQFAKSYRWGVLQPSASLAWKHEMKGQRDPIVARFAFDTDTNNTFDLNADSPDKTYFSLGLGSTFVFTRGWSAYVNYDRLIGLEHITSQQLTFGGRLEL